MTGWGKYIKIIGGKVQEKYITIGEVLQEIQKVTENDATINKRGRTPRNIKPCGISILVKCGDGNYS